MSEPKKNIFNKNDYMPNQETTDEFNESCGTDFTVMDMKMMHDMAVDLLNDGKFPEFTDPENN